QPGNLISELEAVQDLLNVGGEPIQISLEVSPELPLSGAGFQVSQCEARRVVEGLTRCLPQRGFLVYDARLVQRGLQLENRVLSRLQDCIQATENCHRQDYVPILAPDIEVAKNVVSDAPNEVRNPGQ